MADAALHSGPTGGQVSGGRSGAGGAASARQFFGFIQRYRSMLIPAAFVGLVVVILIPLPPALLDILLISNLSLALIILISVIFVQSPLEFSVFPSLLLGATLFRLVLNVATTRLILTAGDRAPSLTGASSAAGRVIQTFANFVAGGSLAVGVIIFVILIIVQFVVITKGSTRISEVAARFTLDAMPGKQMAIDADLNAGMIKEDEARRRRQDIAREADFYGAMDGASKFVRGDAIAGILITLVNIIGGIAIGMLQYGWPITGCFQVFTRLTIGDGLVSQIPAFIISVAAGLLTTRSASRSNLGEEFVAQITSKSPALLLVAGFLIVMSFTGMPVIPLWILAICCATIGLTISRNQKRAAAATVRDERTSAAAAARKPEKIEALLTVDPMELEVGYALVQLVDATRGGDLLDRISLIRKQIAMEMGVMAPPIRIRDNMQLPPNDYIIKLRGNPLAQGSVQPGQFMAMDSGAVTGKLSGTPTKEPAFGLPAWWIPESARAQAELMNYTVVEASGVLATHLTEVIKTHAHELLTREQVAALLKQLKEKAPTLVDEVIPGQLKPGELQKVLQSMLRERVPIRDLEAILETLGDWAAKTRDTDVLYEAVRTALGRTICQQHKDEQNTIHCITVDPQLEDMVNSYIERNERGSVLTLPPQLARQITENISTAVHRLLQQGHNAVVLCSPQVRSYLRRLIEPALPAVAVLAYNEIAKGVNVESVGVAGVGT